ncbi:MAG: hypothetical protein PHR77_02275 [Kiritimatiellae bacterium]|nr:hypothetical protein [Kiritimatiellia bacterium]MDD5521798.1 hypothetical protein [Kiritimatiellia bacterium]
MKRFVIAVMCVGMFMVFNGFAANVTPRKRPSKKAANAGAEAMQCREITLIGVMSDLKEEEIKDKDGKVIQKLKYYLLTDSKKKDWRMPRDYPIAKLKEYEGKKVKIVGMILGGSTLLSIKKLDVM